MKDFIYVPPQTIELDDIRFNHALTNGEKILYAELKSMSKTVDKIRYKRSMLSRLFNVSIPSIDTWIKKLCELGYIEVKKCDNPPKLYIIVPKQRKNKFKRLNEI